MSFPVVKAVAGAVEETAYLVTDVVGGTRYAGHMYKLGMQGAYKTLLAESFDEQSDIDMSKWTDAQKVQYANA